MSHNSKWTNVKNTIGHIKEFSDAGYLFSEREKSQLEEVYNIMLQVPELTSDCRIEQSACLVGITKSFINIIKPYAAKSPEIKNALEVTEQAVEVFAKGFDMVKLVLAVKAFDVNPAGACAAAWGGPQVAKAGIDFIRFVAPNLDTNAETKKIENRVFELVGGGAGAGAGVGAAIGGGIGFLFGGIGAAPGAAIGAAIGGCAGSVTGAVLLALD